MKKIITVLLCLVMMSMVFVPFNMQVEAFSPNSYTTIHRSKAIHVVFDDSGSMVRTGGVYVDRWGQAKYAMEVFAAMLEEQDTMRVYYMSDFDVTANGNINAPPKITIYGTESAATRVERIHETITRTANTPFDPVVKAHADLLVADADEKWLIILADGGFNQLDGVTRGVTPRTIDVNGRLTQYANGSDVNVFFLVIGEDADLLDMVTTITPNPDIGFHFDHARNSNQILEKITSMCNLIFNRNRLALGSRHEFSFDVPMAELLVFAQGADVRINGISGDSTHSPNEAVRVRYSERAGTNQDWTNNPNVIISRNLTGIIATIRDVPIGAFSMDVTGAQTVEIYYKPVVNLDIKLFQNGVEVRDNPVVEGEYQLEFGIVNEDGEFFQSSLLGFVSYTAVATNGGREVHITNGETIHLVPDELIVNVRAQFLEINTAESEIRRRVSAYVPPPPDPTPLDVEITAPNEEFSRKTLNDSGTFIITIRHEGNLLTEEQWRNMDLPVVTTNANVDITEIRRGTSVSTFEFNIRQKNSDPFQTARGTVTINADAKLFCEYHGGHICEGNGSTRVTIQNDISFWEDLREWANRNWHWLKWVLKALAALFLFFLLWGRKKRFPRYMDKEPKIYQTSGTGRGTALEHSGSFKKSLWSRICPFVAHRATINVVAGYDHMLPQLKVKALGGHDMLLTNTPTFLQGQLVDCSFYPDGITRTPQEFDGNIMIPCGGEVKTEFTNMGRRTVYRCHLKKSDEQGGFQS